MRSRTDSIANAVFLIAGGALSLSITVLLNSQLMTLMTEEALSIARLSWYSLLTSIVLALILKIQMVLELYIYHENEDFASRWRQVFNRAGWFIGITSFLLFTYGMYSLIKMAVVLLSSN